MKNKLKYIVLLPITLALVSGCAYVNSNTAVNQQGTNMVSSTHARSFTFFDGHADIAKFRNFTGGPTNSYTQGTSVTGLDQTSSSSNVVNIINAAANAAASVPK